MSERSDITVNNPQSFTITNDSNILQIPVHNITQNTISDQNQNDTTHNTNQDKISILSTSKTQIIQPFQTQQPSPRNYCPPPPPSQYLTQTTPHNSPQQGSSNTHGKSGPQFQPTVQFNTILFEFKFKFKFKQFTIQNSNKTTNFTNLSVYSSSKYPITKYTNWFNN